LGFSRSVRDQILVDTARHCCVCHRYKGVKVEVHHIQQEADGGENTYENAISLCFDCHADAGHYNTRHPKGTKYSPKELKKSKENWLDLVERNAISQPNEPDSFYCRYFICKNYEHLVEIVNSDLARFPVGNPLLLKNSVIDLLSTIISKHPYSYRHANVKGKALQHIDEYVRLYPDATVPNTSDGNMSYFEVTRTPSREEIEELVDQDGLLKVMCESGIPVEKSSLAVGYRDDCGGTPLQEEYIFRNLWCSFLAITNISDVPKTLRSVNSKFVSGSGFDSFYSADGEVLKIRLPGAPIPPNATVLMPLAILLPPFASLQNNIWSEAYDDERHMQFVRHEGNTEVNLGDILVYGDQIFPTSITFDSDGNEAVQLIHKFDLTNMYTIDRSWECGSCPHIFFKSDRLFYEREILARCCRKVGTDRFTVPDNVSKFLIAEIEDETTELLSISVNNRVLIENTVIRKGEYIEISVSSGDQVEIVGQYLPYKESSKYGIYGVKRNELVSGFLHWSNLGLTNTYTCTATLASSLCSR